MNIFFIYLLCSFYLVNTSFLLTPNKALNQTFVSTLQVIYFSFVPIGFADSKPRNKPRNKPSAPPLARVKNVASTAQTLVVKTQFRQFTLHLDTNKIAIKGHGLDLSLEKKPCNAHIIDRFHKEIADFIQKQKAGKNLKTKIKNQNIRTISVRLQGKTYFVDGNSNSGKLWLVLPNEFSRMKWEEKFNCDKTKPKKPSGKK